MKKIALLMVFLLSAGCMGLYAQGGITEITLDANTNGDTTAHKDQNESRKKFCN